jgi:soluble lytic murein transglycosylase-like protein
MGIFIFNGGGAAKASVDRLCEREMALAARKYGVPLAVLYAVGLAESGEKRTLHPYALNLAGPSFFFTNQQEALQRFYDARKKGIKLIDVGCMQINHFYHSSHFESLEEMFDPHQNVDYAARFLKGLRQKEGSWTLAAARYHAGPNNDPAQKRYVCRVISNMVLSGFGAWTSQAKSFCQ